MTRAILLALSLSLPSCTARPEPDPEPRGVEAIWHSVQTTRSVRLRSEPSTESAVLTTIPAHAAVEVQDCGGGWCPARWADQEGFVSQAYLAVEAPEEQARPPAAVPRALATPLPRSEAAPKPRGPPSGASARCRDGTYSYSQNRRGTCSHHGGVAEWF